MVQGALRGYSSPGKGAKNGVRGDREGGSHLRFFFFLFFSRTPFSHRSIPNKSGSVKSKAFVQVAHGAGA